MLTVLSAGLLDTVQDAGRYGYAAKGINPGGAMDPVAAAVANLLCGNTERTPVIEMHFPAASFSFKQTCLIACSGADFMPHINNQPIPVNTPVMIAEGSILQYKKQIRGARTYLAVAGGFDLPQWLNSYSTNLKANAGGYHGRALKKNDELSLLTAHHSRFTIHDSPFTSHDSRLTSHHFPLILPFHADIAALYHADKLHITDGREYSWLSACDASIFSNNSFTVTARSDRMGYRLQGVAFETPPQTELISSAVTKGTVQLLPNGQLIVLAADHQTTGGYPRIAHVITADLPTLAQMNPGTQLHFERISFEEAEERLIQQHTHLLQLQNALNFRLDEWFKQYNTHRS